MDQLFSTTGESLLASLCFVWVFFSLSWILDRPVIWNSLHRQVSRISTLKEKQVEEVVNGVMMRVVSTVHNTTQVVLSLCALTSPVLWEDTFHGVTQLSQLLTVISAGYFVWDTAASIWRVPVDGIEFVVHGAISFAFCFYSMYTGKLHFYCCSVLLWEISTPFVIVRWFLYRTGMKNTKLYIYNGVVMMISFGLCRILWGAYLTRKFVLSSLAPQESISWMVIWVLRLLCVVMNGLNWFWFRKMVVGALALLFKKAQKSSNGEIKKRSNGNKED